LTNRDGKILYESANGDVWRLVRDPRSGVPMVEHEPNVSSGGNGPEHHALLALIDTLIHE